MIAVAIYAADPRTREHLTMLAGADGVRIVGSVDNPASLSSLLDHVVIGAVLTEAPADVGFTTWLSDRRVSYVVLVWDGDRDAAHDALAAGAMAVLPKSASARAVCVAIEGAMNGLSVVAQSLRDDPGSTDLAAPPETPEPQPLTPRELEVLAALADGASNKVIARRLGISFHTVKFHIASIFEKLDAESRTEALAEAARRGLVML
jgi:DNA-binding NarL/FixJ family response regulator